MIPLGDKAGEVGTTSATVEIIMRVVARTHRLIQLNDSFAGPKHHLRVCPGSICISVSVDACVCVRARVPRRAGT